jgi:hypothetical protein
MSVFITHSYGGQIIITVDDNITQIKQSCKISHTLATNQHNIRGYITWGVEVSYLNKPRINDHLKHSLILLTCNCTGAWFRYSAFPDSQREVDYHSESEVHFAAVRFPSCNSLCNFYFSFRYHSVQVCFSIPSRN